MVIITSSVSNFAKTRLLSVSQNVAANLRSNVGSGSQIARFTSKNKDGPKTSTTLRTPEQQLRPGGVPYSDPGAVRKAREALGKESSNISNSTTSSSSSGDVTFLKATGPSDISPNTPNYSFPASTRKLSASRASGGGPTTATTSNTTLTNGSNGNGGGGGGGGIGSGSGGGISSGGGNGGVTTSNGKHKCPKCGSSVTFKHNDFEENTFYCANCSGWFLVKNADKQIDQQQNNASQNAESATSDDSNEDKGSAKQRKIARPQILMEHVSSFTNHTFFIYTYIYIYVSFVNVEYIILNQTLILTNKYMKNKM